MALEFVRIRTWACLAWLALWSGCMSEPPIADPFAEPADWLPPLDTRGERVWFGTDLVEQVCGGTLASLEDHVVSIEAELGLEPIEQPTWFWVLQSDSFAGLCSTPSAPACAEAERVYSHAFGWYARRHELVHARVFSQGIIGHRVFREGLAAALDQDGGCLASEACAALDLESLLRINSNAELEGDVYTAAADLVHGMLMAHGPAAVLAFMADVSSNAPPDEIRSKYAAHFNRDLDEDFIAYRRGPLDTFTIGQMGCLFPEAPSADLGGVKISAAMDCDSPLVANEFEKAHYGTDGIGIGKWSFTVEPEQAGAFVLSRPASTELGNANVRPCAGPGFTNEHLADTGPWTFGSSLNEDGWTIYLGPGLHRITWQAEFGSELEFELAPACIFEQANCPGSDQCTIWNECMPQVPEPAALGEPCTQEPDGPRACEAGARCLGGVCVSECDFEQQCDDSLTCSRIRVCGPSCDLLEQDCEPGFSCLPAADASSTALGRGACVAAGTEPVLSSCDRRDNSCEVGTSCEWVASIWSGVECMEGPLGQLGGCCVPFCDPAASDPGCPAQVPRCDPIADGPVGVCRGAAQ